MTGFSVVLFGQEYKYRVGNPIGAGAFGRVNLVYLAGRERAPIVMKTIPFTSPELETLAKRELSIHLSLVSKNVHENIIGMFGVKHFPGQVCMFLEYGGERTLSSMIPKHGMSQPEAGGYFQQLMNGVKFIHSRGITHGDIKPSNIVITKQGKVKIIDFGVSYEHVDGNGKYRKVPSKRGTEKYGAPEIFGNEDIDGPPTDVWSCAMTLCQMLAGSVPWTQAISAKSDEFKNWSQGTADFSCETWIRIDRIAFDLLKNMLTVDTKKRATVDFVMHHVWFRIAHQNLRRTPIATINDSGKYQLTPLKPLVEKYSSQLSLSSLSNVSPIQSRQPIQSVQHGKNDNNENGKGQVPTRPVGQELRRSLEEKLLKPLEGNKIQAKARRSEPARSAPYPSPSERITPKGRRTSMKREKEEEVQDQTPTQKKTTLLSRRRRSQYS